MKDLFEDLDFDFDTLIDKIPQTKEEEAKSTPKEEEEVKEVEKVKENKKNDIGFFENEFEGDKKEDPSDKKEESTKEVEDSNELNTFAAALKESGVLPNIDIKEFNKLDAAGQAQYLLDKQNDEINDRLAVGFNDWLDTLPTKLKTAIEHYTEGASLEAIVKGVDSLERYQNINPDALDKNEELATRLIIEEKIALGYTREEAEEEVENIRDKAKSAKKSLNKLIKLEEDKIEADKTNREARVKEEEVNAQKIIKGIQKTIQESKEIIPGIPLNDKVRTATYKNLTIPVVKTPDGRMLNSIMAEREKDPQGFEIKVAHLFTLTNGFKNFDIFNNISKTNATRELEKALERNDYNKGKGSEPVLDKKNGETSKELIDFFTGLI